MDISDQQFNLLLAEYKEAMDNYKYRDRLIVREFNLIFIVIGVIISTYQWTSKFNFVVFLVLTILLIWALVLIKKDVILNANAKLESINKAKTIEAFLWNQHKEKIRILQQPQKKVNEQTKQDLILTTGLATLIGENVKFYGMPSGNFSKNVEHFITCLIYLLMVSILIRVYLDLDLIDNFFNRFGSFFCGRKD